MPLDPTNPNAIAEAIVFLLEHLDAAQRMRESGRKEVLESIIRERRKGGCWIYIGP